MNRPASFLQRRPLDAARRALLDGVRAVGAERVDVGDACDRVSAEEVRAARPSPHYRASAMDGIAVRSRDTWNAADGPVVLTARDASLPAPQDEEPACVPVDTGSALPEWTDAVIRIEDVTADGAGFRIKAVVPPGRDVRRIGEDIEQATVLLPEGARIRPWDIGALLATGTRTIDVRRRPRIAILATGSEVVEPGAPAGPGQVIDSNSRLIAALVGQWGGSPHRLGIVADDENRLRAALADAAARFDAVCVIAGSSAGRKDFTIAVLASLGEVFVHGVDIAPGRPVALARIGACGDDAAVTPVIAVPGYPVSAIVVCNELLRPLVAALLGSTAAVAPSLRARLARKIPSRLGMEEFRRVCLARQDDASYVVAPLAAGAGSIATVSGAHGWLRIDAAAEGLDDGIEVDVELLVSREDVDAAFVLAGEACDEGACLERLLRRRNPRARVHYLRAGPADAPGAVARGEAHGAFVDGGSAAAAPLRELAVAAVAHPMLVLAGSSGERMLVHLDDGPAGVGR
ncbi:MAG TPA: gephyrin-like molybdotransferase Glp [Candidatus Binatia bacterium]|jgi:putative molybdopterin biosynthesis protein